MWQVRLAKDQRSSSPFRSKSLENDTAKMMAKVNTPKKGVSTAYSAYNNPNNKKRINTVSVIRREFG